MGGAGRPLLFAHANGFPPGSYRQFIEALGARFAVRAVEHRPLWGEAQPPQRLRWSLFADDLLRALEQQYDEPVWVMGHSLGAVVAVLAARRSPQRFAGLILLDPVFLPSRYVMQMRLLPEAGRRRIPMLRRALARPEYFDDAQSAFDFYRSKRAFRGLNDEALRDYIASSKAPVEEGGLRLRYPGAWEAAVYGSPPLVRAALRRLRLPTVGLRGRDSDTLRPEMFARWAHWQPDATLREVPGGHLFPLEHPRQTADTILGELFPE
jgi:pimeloyl-ACP methyl ester carboxylesterase